MNHLIAWLLVITAFGSGLYGIYKFIYDAKPIHYWLNKKQKIKKRYKTYRKHKAKKRNRKTKISKLNWHYDAVK